MYALRLSRSRKMETKNYIIWKWSPQSDQPVCKSCEHGVKRILDLNKNKRYRQNP